MLWLVVVFLQTEGCPEIGPGLAGIGMMATCTLCEAVCEALSVTETVYEVVARGEETGFGIEGFERVEAGVQL